MLCCKCKQHTLVLPFISYPKVTFLQRLVRGHRGSNTVCIRCIIWPCVFFCFAVSYKLPFFVKFSLHQMLCLVSSLFTPAVALLEVRPADAILGLCQSLEKALSSGAEGLSVIQR